MTVGVLFLNTLERVDARLNARYTGSGIVCYTTRPSRLPVLLGLEPHVGHAKRSSKRSDLLRLVRVDPKSTVPLLAQLEEQFAWLIASGQVKAGEALPSTRELALHLGIHRHTVRTAYRRLVARGLAKARPGRAVEALPAERAPPLPEGRRRLTFTIGVLVPGLNPFYDPFLRGIQDASRESPWLSFPCYAYNDPQLAARYLRELVAKGVDGLILAAGLPQAADGTPRLESLPAGMPPTVYADMPEMPGHAVLLDSEGAGCQATRHLLQHGHRRIGMISGPLQWPNLYACQRGYRRALEVAGIQPDPYLLVEDPDFTLEAGGAAPPSACWRSRRRRPPYLARRMSWPSAPCAPSRRAACASPPTSPSSDTTTSSWPRWSNLR